MSRVHCFTSVSYSYLSRARVMAQTVRRHHPDWTIWLCLSDREPPGFEFDLASEPFDRVVRVEELDIGQAIDPWLFKHNVVELCTAVKGAMLKRVLDAGAERVIYIDPDIALFNPLEGALAALDANAIVLTPHLVTPEVKGDRAAPWPNEISALMHGVYNLGFVGVRNDDEGRRFAQWWRDRLIDLCYEEAEKGVYTDQRWCDLVPAFFDRVKILRDPGYNVASWNLKERPMRFGADGQILIHDHKLRFYHFTKIDSIGELAIDRLAQDSLIYELIIWYRAQLKHNTANGIPQRWWAYGAYSDGTPITMADRVLYRTRPDLERLFPDPFNAETYLDWLKRERLAGR
ncbi:MAG: hypothetical protein JO107_01250 [Hyphomicrobiales bacterium]|nr:hypothetical protein [Hyphomicrobiales bacterium]MBV8661704.1 hypothetical protein [Hyphomicrobiales bacterium]